MNLYNGLGCYLRCIHNDIIYYFDTVIKITDSRQRYCWPAPKVTYFSRPIVSNEGQIAMLKEEKKKRLLLQQPPPPAVELVSWASEVHKS